VNHELGDVSNKLGDMADTLGDMADKLDDMETGPGVLPVSHLPRGNGSIVKALDVQLRGCELEPRLCSNLQ